MKKLLHILLIIGISALIFSCKKEETEIHAPVKQIVKNESYEEIALQKIKIHEDKNSIVYQLQSNLKDTIKLTLYLESEQAILSINNYKIKTDLNFTYDIYLEDAIEEIKLLNSNSNYVFFFPVTTEEYLTFEILKFNKASKKYYTSGFAFETHEPIHDVYMKTKPVFVEKNNEYHLTIGKYNFKGKFEKLEAKAEILEEFKEEQPTKEKNEINNFVVSCGTECAIVFNAEKIVKNGDTITVDFKVEQYIKEKLVASNTDVLTFYYDEQGNVEKILNTKTGENVLEFFSGGSANESFIEFGKSIYQ